jgi:flagellum-specific peptidoglycan hydrolase FlgJ
MSKVTDYINKHAMGAVWAARGSGILPETIICQSASESSWGESLLASKYNNYFGIKADSSWKGRYVTLLTREYVNGRYISVGAKFRAYSSFAESASDYIQFLKKNKRYVNVFSQKTIYTQLVALKVAGYATEPNYATIINNIYLSNKTTIDTAIKKAKNNLSLAFAGIGLGVYFLVRKYLPQIVKSVKG